MGYFIGGLLAGALVGFAGCALFTVGARADAEADLQFERELHRLECMRCKGL